MTGKTIIKEYKDGELVREYEGGNVSLNMDGGVTVTQGNYRSKYFEWTRHYWRPLMAMLYFAMCLLDYIIRPTINASVAKRFDISSIIAQIRDIDVAIQVKILDIASRQEFWGPIMSSEVHYVFLVILGVAAWTRGKEKEELSKRGNV